MDKLLDKYTYHIEWSEEDNAHVARCLEFPSLGAHGDTVEAALKEIKFVVKEVVRWLEEDKEPIPKPLGLRNRNGDFISSHTGDKQHSSILDHP